VPRYRHLLAVVIGVLITVSAGGGALAQKNGGILKVYLCPASFGFRAR
jgi:hypothetical protein